MNGEFRRKCMCFGIILLGSISLIFAAQDNSYAQSSKKVGQLNFQLPDDWPVEKRGGLMTPIPTEEYVSIKFKEIEKEFQTIKDDFSEKFKDFESDLKSINEDLSKEVKKLQLQRKAQRVAGANLTDIRSSIELFKGELARLDRVIANKIKDMQAKLEQINPQIKFIKENLDGLQTQIYKLDEKIDYFQEGRHRSY